MLGKRSVLLYTDQFVICLAVAFPASPEGDLGRLDALARGSYSYIGGLITRHSCIERATAPFFCCVIIKEEDFSNYR